MTREEALYQVKGYLTDIIPAEDYSEVEEIIKALEQESCPYYMIDDDGHGLCKNHRALEQEPKTGHWIANAPQYDMLNPQYICSECGNAHTRTTPYCEMCGAKMVEPQESEDKE